MKDLISQGLVAVSLRRSYAPELVFLAGAITSIGPCVAPRFVAVAGLAAGKSRKQAVLLVAAFISGLMATYGLFGAVSSLLPRATQLSTYTYVAVAISLAAGGCIMLWRDECACDRAPTETAGASAGGALLLGACFALVLSPCCTPVVLAILAYTSASGSAMYGSALLACYALGHAMPLVAVAFGMQNVSAYLQRHFVQQAAAVVGGTLMLAVAGLYASLA